MSGRAEKVVAQHTEPRTERLHQLFQIMFQAHPWHGIPATNGAPGVYNAHIEIVPADVVKYELDKASGHLQLDRPQRLSSICPMLYGFIPQTYCGERVGARCAERADLPGIHGDKDPLDVCLLSEKNFAHGNFLARGHPIGGLRLIDGNEADDKIVAVLESDVAFAHIRELEECPQGIIERLQHYFLSYKQRPCDRAHRVRITEIYDRAEALEVIARAIADYRDHFGAPESRILEVQRLLSGR